MNITMLYSKIIQKQAVITANDLLKDIPKAKGKKAISEPLNEPPNEPTCEATSEPIREATTEPVFREPTSEPVGEPDQTEPMQISENNENGTYFYTTYL